MQPRALACLLGAALFAAAGEARAQGKDEKVGASECCPYLLPPVSARSMGLADAVVARSAFGAMFANPSLIADVDRDQFVIHSANTTWEKSTTLSLLIYSKVAGTFGVSYRLVDQGEQLATDEFNNPTGTLAIFSQVLTATYATRVGEGLNAGVTYKLYQARSDCRGYCAGFGSSGTTHGVDLGVQYKPGRWPDLQLGVSVVNVGFPLQEVNKEQEDPMPARVRLGLAYELAHHFREDRQVELWAEGDVAVNPRDLAGAQPSLGVELAVEQTIFLWAGYAAGTGLSSGAGIGVGLRYDRFEVGVARRFISSDFAESEPTQVSFGIRF